MDSADLLSNSPDPLLDFEGSHHSFKPCLELQDACTQILATAPETGCIHRNRMCVKSHYLTPATFSRVHLR